MTIEYSADLIDGIRKFVAERTNYFFEQVTPETTLFGDLGVYGNDAEELLTEFARQFKVSLDGFYFCDHFEFEWDPLRPAFIALLYVLSARFRRSWRAAKARERDITIAHLARCAALGRWVPSQDLRRPRPLTPWRLFWRVVGIVFAPIAVATVLMFVLIGIAGLYGLIFESRTAWDILKSGLIIFLGFAVTLNAARTISDLRIKIRGPVPSAGD